MGAGFSVDQIPDLHGKVFVVTGANTGIGLTTTRQLAKHGARVVLACRSEAKALAAIASIQEELGDACPPLEFAELDLNSLQQVEAAARKLAARGLKIDVLVNNAGIMMCPYALTKDGLESQIGVNHFAHFVWTMLLLPSLRRDGPTPPRIVNLSSLAHTMPYSWGLSTLDQVMVREGDAKDAAGKHASEAIYSPTGAYGQSKLCNLLFTKYVAARAPWAKVYAVHPGYVDTELQRNIGGAYGGFVAGLATVASKVFAKNPENGARTTLAAATHAALDTEEGNAKAPSGTYFVPYGEVATPSAFARDEAMQARLWDMSLEVVRRVLGEKVASEMETNLVQA
ncbi:hypothetical protein H9P43_006525 [Blastocladiella emersonii ATCC 22665]|nr:hypothetical protein H9P43_006525 [Blastocladiella emersonii ATCC 22665]